MYKSVKDDNSSSNPVSYTVAFNTNGGTPIDSVTVESGSKVTKPQNNPTNGNYTFVNWYSNAELTQLFDFNTSITADTTIYAKWVVNFKIEGSSYSVDPGTKWQDFCGEGFTVSGIKINWNAGSEDDLEYDEAVISKSRSFDDVVSLTDIIEGIDYFMIDKGEGFIDNPEVPDDGGDDL